MSAVSITSAADAKEATTRPAHSLPDDAKFDDQVGLLKTAFHGPGYHSKVADGTPVHPTRDSMSYALALLGTDSPERLARAVRIIRLVLPMQETRADSAYFGTWPWLAEEPVEKMAPPDMNWCAFIGVRLCEMLVRYPDRLTHDLREQMKQSLGNACKAIILRNIGPDYTNISAMSAAVLICAGEQLPDPAMLKVGNQRLQQLLDYTKANGSFAEYNSPNYTPVALEELERIIRLSKSREAQQNAEQLRRMAWQCIADHFHPGTGEWAGPHSRSYSDRLNAGVTSMIARRTGVRIGTYNPPAEEELSADDRDPRLRCPADLVDRFRRLPRDPLVVLSDFRRDPNSAKAVRGTTWLTLDACLGTINRDSLWTQRRPLVAYWNASDAVAVFRIRCIKNDRDFASAEAIITQIDNRALAGVRLRPGMGDWHLSLDKPTEGKFPMSELLIRCELTAPGATVTALANDVYELRAGGRKAVIHTASGATYDGKPMKWQTGRSEKGDRVWLDGVYYSGKGVELTIPKLSPLLAALGIELLVANDTPADDALHAADEGWAWTPRPDAPFSIKP